MTPTNELKTIINLKCKVLQKMFRIQCARTDCSHARTASASASASASGRISRAWSAKVRRPELVVYGVATWRKGSTSRALHVALFGARLAINCRALWGARCDKWRASERHWIIGKWSQQLNWLNLSWPAQKAKSKEHNIQSTEHIKIKYKLIYNHMYI